MMDEETKQQTDTDAQLWRGPTVLGWSTRPCFLALNTVELWDICFISNPSDAILQALYQSYF